MNLFFIPWHVHKGYSSWRKQNLSVNIPIQKFFFTFYLSNKRRSLMIEISVFKVWRNKIHTYLNKNSYFTDRKLLWFATVKILNALHLYSISFLIKAFTLKDIWWQYTIIFTIISKWAITLALVLQRIFLYCQTLSESDFSFGNMIMDLLLLTWILHHIFMFYKKVNSVAGLNNDLPHLLPFYWINDTANKCERILQPKLMTIFPMS